MARTELKSILLVILSGLLAVVFLYAGVLKVLDPAAFLEDIENYRLVPYPVAWMMAYFLPWLEIFAGLALLFKRWRVAGLMILLVLMVVFTGALLSAWGRGLDIQCGCFGKALQSSNYPLLLIRDLLLLTMVITVGLLVRSRRRAERS